MRLHLISADKCLTYPPAYSLVQVQDGGEVERIRMEAPPALLVLAYMQKLRMDDPNQALPSRKCSAIRAMACTGISSVMNEFSVSGESQASMVKRASASGTPALATASGARASRL